MLRCLSIRSYARSSRSEASLPTCLWYKVALHEIRHPLTFVQIALRVGLVFVTMSFANTVNAQWGTIKGTVTLNRGVARLPAIVRKGDPAVKDAAVCSAADLPDESVLVDSRSNGLANVVVYLANKPSVIHPDLVSSKRKDVEFQLKGCRFVTHVLVVRTDQDIHILSNDAIAHNVHPNSQKNRISANIFLDRMPIVDTFRQSERLPFKVTCDIHPWMEAYWVVLDHPYVSVTNEKGEFEISKLPEGDHTFRIWHEKAGYLDKSYKVTVKAGVNNVGPITFAADKVER